MERTDIFHVLHTFVARELLGGDGDGLDGGTRLLETGILDSMSMIDLIAHLERSFGLTIPHREIRPENFESLDAVVELVLRVRAAAAATSATAADARTSG